MSIRRVSVRYNRRESEICGTEVWEMRLAAKSIDWRECFLWIGCVNNRGYGVVRRGGNAVYVHRLAFLASGGSLTGDEVVGHRCHDAASQAGECSGGVPCLHRRCWNPRHLAAQTGRENFNASGSTIAARRRRITHCRAGHELSGGNLIQSKLKVGVRDCRQCAAIRAAKGRAA